MIAGGSRTIPGAYDSLLTQGMRLRAQAGDLDIDEQPVAHRPDWRPAPSEDVSWKADVVEAAWEAYRRRSRS